MDLVDLLDRVDWVDWVDLLDRVDWVDWVDRVDWADRVDWMGWGGVLACWVNLVSDVLWRVRPWGYSPPPAVQMIWAMGAFWYSTVRV